MINEFHISPLSKSQQSTSEERTFTRNNNCLNRKLFWLCFVFWPLTHVSSFMMDESQQQTEVEDGKSKRTSWRSWKQIEKHEPGQMMMIHAVPFDEPTLTNLLNLNRNDIICLWSRFYFGECEKESNRKKSMKNWWFYHFRNITAPAKWTSNSRITNKLWRLLDLHEPPWPEIRAKTVPLWLLRVKQLRTENRFGELEPQRMDFYPNGRF